MKHLIRRAGAEYCGQIVVSPEGLTALRALTLDASGPLFDVISPGLSGVPVVVEPGREGVTVRKLDR